MRCARMLRIAWHSSSLSGGRCLPPIVLTLKPGGSAMLAGSIVPTSWGAGVAGPWGHCGQKNSAQGLPAGTLAMNCPR
jgi:hypothetical protein